MVCYEQRISTYLNLHPWLKPLIFDYGELKRILVESVHDFPRDLLQKIEECVNAIDCSHGPIASVRSSSRVTRKISRVAVPAEGHDYIRGAVLGLTVLKILKKATKAGLDTHKLRR